MNEPQAHQLLQELADDVTFPTKAELDTTYVRPDGSGYCVTITWQVRKATVKSRGEWLSLKQAWQDPGQSEQRPSIYHRKSGEGRSRDAKRMG
jgi:hypothetical protein